MNKASIVEVFANDGEYEHHAKTVIKLSDGSVQAVIEDKATVEGMLEP